MELWLVWVLLRVVISYGLFQYLLKRVVSAKDGKKVFVTQFLFCILVADTALFVFGEPSFTLTTLGVMALGAFTAFGTWWDWKATQISQSKNAVLTIFDNIIAMSISYFVFTEGQYLNAVGITGIALSLVAVFAFGIHDWFKEDHPEKTKPVFYAYVMACSVIWGISIFLQKYFGMEGVDTYSFVASWYTGAFLTALALTALRCHSAGISFPAELKACFAKEHLVPGAVLGACIMVCLVLAYWAYRLAPQTIVQPIFLVSQMFLPCLMGLYIFGEIKNFGRPDKALLLLGFAGGILVALSY